MHWFWLEENENLANAADTYSYIYVRNYVYGRLDVQTFRNTDTT